MTPLHEIGRFVRDLLAEVPLPVVRALFVALPVAVLIWVCRLPRDVTTPPGGTGRWDENLKVWAGVALIVQIAIYSLL